MVCIDINSYTPANMYIAGLRVVRAADSAVVKGIIGTTTETSTVTAVAGEQVKVQITIENNGQLDGSGTVNVTASNILNQNISFTIKALSSTTVTSNNFAQPSGDWRLCAEII